jgi:hypothetical protein
VASHATSVMQALPIGAGSPGNEAA